MIKVMYGTDATRKALFACSDDTPIEVLESEGTDLSVGNTYLDGHMLDSDDLKKSFRDLGVEDTVCYLLHVIKHCEEPRRSEPAPITKPRRVVDFKAIWRMIRACLREIFLALADLLRDDE